jgi:hypothetical protein
VGSICARINGITVGRRGEETEEEGVQGDGVLTRKPLAGSERKGEG